MLVNFSVRNFRTFRERAEWSLVASPDKTREADNVIDVPAFGLRLLKSAVVYGANASGKSKLVEAMDYVRSFVLRSSVNGQVGQPTGVTPFRLNPASAQAPSEFEIQFVHQNELYRYGFEVSATRVESEWLFVRAAKGIRNKAEVELFYRDKQEITFHARQFGGIVNELVKNAAVRENALLLSVAAQFNQPRAAALLDWFEKLLILSGRDEAWERVTTYLAMHNPAIKKDMVGFLEHADLGIEQLRGGQEEIMLDGNRPDKAREIITGWSDKQHAGFKTLRRAYNDAREPVESVEFSLPTDESTGTKKMLYLAGPVLMTLNVGAPLVIDELDARLHPNLVCKIVHLFNSAATNPLNAQLLFNTHDTNLLASGNFRRDQIWFTEKNRYGEASLYSLADFKTDQVRKDDDFEANYVRGKYGAVPYLGNFGALPTAETTPETAPRHDPKG